MVDLKEQEMLTKYWALGGQVFWPEVEIVQIKEVIHNDLTPMECTTCGDVVLRKLRRQVISCKKCKMLRYKLSANDWNKRHREI